MPDAAELEFLLEESRKEVEAIRGKLHNAIRKGKGLQASLLERDARVDELESQLHEQRQQTDAELQAVKAALDEARARGTELEGALEEAKREADAATASVRRRTAVIAELEEEIALIRTETDAEKLHLAQAAESARAEARALADQLKVARAAPSAEAQRLDAQLANATAELASMKRAAEALQDELTHTTARLSQELADARAAAARAVADARAQAAAAAPPAAPVDALSASVQTDASVAGVGAAEGECEGEALLRRQLASVASRLDEQCSRLQAAADRETAMLWEELATATAVAARALQGVDNGGRSASAAGADRGLPESADGEGRDAGAGQAAGDGPLAPEPGQSSSNADGEGHSEASDAASSQEQVEVFRKKAVAALRRAKAAAAEAEEVKEKLAAVEAEDESLRRLVDRLEGDAAARQEALTLLTMKLAETEQELATARADAQTASSLAIASQQSQLNDLSKQLEDAEARASAAEEELATATSALRAAATKVTGLEAECDELEAKLEAAARDVSDLRADYAASQRQLESAEAVASKAVSVEEALKLDLAQLRRQNAELTGRLEHADDLQATCDLVSSKLQVAKERTATLEDEGTELRHQLTEALRRLSQAEQERAREPDASDAAVADTSDKEAELEARRAELEDELERLRLQRQEAEELREELAAKLAAAEAKSAQAASHAAALQEQQAALARDAQQRLTVFNALQSSFALKEDAWRAQVQDAEQKAAAALRDAARLEEDLAEALEKCSALDAELQQTKADAQDAAVEHAHALNALQHAHSLAEHTVAAQTQALQDAQRQAVEARAAAEVAEGLPERVLQLVAALEAALADAQGARASLAREEARGKQAHARAEGLLLQLASYEKRAAPLDQDESAGFSHVITISSGAAATADSAGVEASSTSTSMGGQDGAADDGRSAQERLREAERRLGATEARLAAQASAAELLEQENKQLRWQVAMSSGQHGGGHHAPPDRSSAAAPVEERLRALSASASTAERVGAVVGFVLKYRWWLAFGYMALLHGIVYFALTHGMLTRHCVEARLAAAGRRLQAFGWL